MKRRTRKWEVKRLDQLQALASPVREGIVSRLARIGPASIREVAEALGRKPTALYPHFERLAEAGLVREVGERPTARRPETLWDTPGRRLRLRYDPKDARRRAALAAAVGASMRRSERQLTAALESDGARTRGKRRDTLWFQESGWVTREELAELNEHVEAIRKLLGRARPEPGTSLQAVAVALFPDGGAGGA